jgi:hypothetical protein
VLSSVRAKPGRTARVRSTNSATAGGTSQHDHPRLWPARPLHDLGAAICATLVFTIGMTIITMRGARGPVGK